VRLQKIFATWLLIWFLLTAFSSVSAKEPEAYFSLSSDRTYLPGEKVKIRVYANGVNALEFRVYRIDDPAAFFEKLDDVHSFGHVTSEGPIEEKTWIERFHDWKGSLWYRVRDFMRSQYSPQSRAKIREAQAEAQRSKISTATEFAMVPLLNSRQLVARWREEASSGVISENSEIPIDLKSGVYIVESTDGTLRAYTVLIVSKLGLVTKTAPGQLLAYTVDRHSGAPVQNASVLLWGSKKEVVHLTSDASGLSESPIQDYKLENTWILAQHGDDVGIVAPYSLNLSSDSGRDWTGFVYTDRPVYRPGHTVHLKGILRNRSGDRYKMPAGVQVQVAVNDPTSKTVFQKNLTLSAMGTVHADFDIPAGAALGYYSISISTQSSEGGGANGSFDVEEYKKPEYQVKVTPEKPLVLQGDPINATIDSRYYFGEPVANAKVSYVVHVSDYWSPYFDEDQEDMPQQDTEEGGGEEGDYDAGSQVSQQTGQLDANGQLKITIPTRITKTKSDVRYRVEARVMDASNREISGFNYVLVPYGSFKVGISAQSYFYRLGDTARFNVEARDYDGKPIQTPVHVEIFRYDWRKPREKERPIQSTDSQTDSNGLANVSFKIPTAGDFNVRVTATTPENRQVSGATGLWVEGRGSDWFSGESREIKIIPDKKSYSVGDTAKLLLMTGVADAHILITTEGHSIQSHQIVTATGPSVNVEIPITADCQPNIYVGAVFVRDDQLYQASKDLKVPAVEQKLDIQIQPSKPQFQPGENASYAITVKDSKGKPVAGEFSIGVVDEAIYAIRPDNADIMSAFYGNRWTEVQTESSLGFYFHGEAGKKQMPIAGLGRAYRALAQLKPAETLVQPKIRKAFPDTALWISDVKTDANGHAQTNVTFPDSLTTWRTTVRGVTSDTKVGSAVQRVIVRKNLMVRLAVPRFFRQGDEVTVSAIVHNYLEDTKTVKVSLDVTGLDVLQGATTDITVPSKGEAKVDWRVKAQNVRGASLTTKALTNEESDAMELDLPVVPFGVKMADSKSGSVAGASGQQDATITFPAGTELSSHSLDLSVTPSVAGTIFGALDYLTSYPYGCTEQTMSSFLPNIVVAKAAQDLGLKTTINQDELKQKIRAGMDRLYDFQHDDGGWGWWKDDESAVFMTAYVVSGLSQAQAAGYDVKDGVISRGQEWLKGALKKYPNMRVELRAYVAYALAQSGSKDENLLNTIWDRRAKGSAQALALTGLTLQMAGDSRAKTVADELENQAKSSDVEAWWEGTYDYLMEFEIDDSPETTAYAIKLLSLVKPQSPLLPKAAFWLATHRADGYFWYSTKQTAMVIFGLTDYLKASHELNADFTVEVSLNDKTVLTRKFTAADTTSAAAPAIHLTFDQFAAGENKIHVRKTGQGRLYWSARGEYYSTEKKDIQSNRIALSITREYFRLTPQTENERIVYKLDPLTGTVQPGDVIAVKLNIGGSDWRYLLIEDPIPAGMEFIERDDLYEIKDRPGWWEYWFSRREFHDDRAAFFQTYFSGRHDYFYLLKVVEPGKFRVSPALVQPMYQPSIISTTDTTQVEVK
jgi:uncharacterized protein YfaS (alpha-2-macroglobulin family)